MTKQKFLLQGAILTAVSLFLRITNMGYRSYLSQKIGSEGMGLYQLIFSVFMLTVTLSTSGISLAVTRMVSAAIAAGRRESIRSTVARCFGFCLTISLCI
ncbi:MAG: oligosaccharide flippase family protein, partial [Neglectibacter timonensis]